MKIENELTALQNFANKFELKVEKYFFEDSRKKTKFILVKNNTSVCQPFNYNEMNIFLLGILRAKKFNL